MRIIDRWPTVPETPYATEPRLGGVLFLGDLTATEFMAGGVSDPLTLFLVGPATEIKWPEQGPVSEK